MKNRKQHKQQTAAAEQHNSALYCNCRTVTLSRSHTVGLPDKTDTTLPSRYPIATLAGWVGRLPLDCCCVISATIQPDRRRAEK